MIKVLATALFIMCLASVVMAQDPVKVDSKHYKVEFENSQVRVLRAKLEPHEKSVMHGHPNAVAIFVTDTNVKFTLADGTTQDVVRKAGEALWTPATTHLPENTTDQAFEVIVVELKQPTKKLTAAKSSHHTAGKKH
ncbi:MAG: cupin domain-containing protein [Pyrinomonadaceae bacterium]|nr:cupin domain-containing protein [Pyrinomonadaceae bacterium]